MLFMGMVFCVFSSFIHAQDSSIEIEKIKPPPRDIKDVLKLLEQSKPDLTQIEKAKKIILSAVPSTQDSESLNNFYSRRSKAYQDLGKINLAINDMRIAVEQYPAIEPRIHLLDLVNLGVYESLGGKNTNAIQAFKNALLWQENKLPKMLGWSISIQRLLITTNVVAGNFDEAKKYLDKQTSLFSSLKKYPSFATFGPSWESQCLSSIGIYSMHIGEWDESEKSLRKAISILEMNYEKVKNSDKKIDELDQETRVYVDSTTNPRNYITQIINRELDLSNVLLRQGRLIDAEYFARKAINLSLNKFGRNSTDAGRSVSVLSKILTEQGRSSEAVLLARAALDSIKEGGASDDSIVLAQARRSLAHSYVLDKNYAEAILIFKEMTAGINLDVDLAKKFKTEDIDWVWALLQTDKPAEAQAMTAILLEKTVRSAGKESAEIIIIRAFEAIALQSQGKWLEANLIYKDVIPKLIDRVKNDTENDRNSFRKSQRINYIFESYLAALSYLAKQDDSQAVIDSFQIADLVRGSSVQKALTASAARSNIKDPQLVNLARQEQDLQRRITALSELLTALLSSNSEQQNQGVLNKIRTDIVTLQSNRKNLKNEITKNFPRYSDLVEPKPATISETKKILRADEVLVSWYFSDKAGYVWAVSQTDKPQFYSLSINRSQLAREIKLIRKALDPGVNSVEEIPAFDIKLSHQLYKKILEPVLASLNKKKSLIAVPHAELGQLPLSVLVTKQISLTTKNKILFDEYKTVPWLINEISITQIPSVTALASLRSISSINDKRKNFIGFGDPYFSLLQKTGTTNEKNNSELSTRGVKLQLRNANSLVGVNTSELAQLPRLPDTAQEIEDIAKIFDANADDIFLHEKASVNQVLSMDLTDRKVIMFSTHGLVPGELEGLTQPALALSSPDITGDKDDGLLTMDKIISLKLNADWVVLSACNTAAGEGAGSEAVSGLGRAFFYSGARALLVSNWPVDSSAARQLMTDLFTIQKKNDKSIRKADSLRMAMLNQIEKGGAVKENVMQYSYSHPLFWAPFVLVGD